MEYINKLFHFFDNKIDEIDVIFVTNPPLLLKIGTKIGISHQIVKEMIKCAMLSFQKILKTSSSSSSSSSSVNSDLDEMLKLMLTILVIKGDMPIILNARRRLVMGKKIMDLEDEIKFIDIILYRHPKSPSLWEYRRFILQQLSSSSSSSSSSFISAEIKCCEKMCDKYSRNYYGWNHRLWLSINYFTTKELYLHEIESMHEWMRSHPSDHSAVSYHIHLVNALLLKKFPSRKNDLSLIEDMFQYNKCMIELYPEYSTFWLHRRMLIMVMSARSSNNNSHRNDELSVSSLIEKELKMFTKVEYKHLCESHILQYNRYISKFGFE